jgi:hypothetical protein
VVELLANFRRDRTARRRENARRVLGEDDRIGSGIVNAAMMLIVFQFTDG